MVGKNVAGAVTISLDDKQVQAMMVGAIAAGTDLTPVMKQSGVWMQHSTAQTFRMNGRPRWRPLSPVTIARRRRGRGGGCPQILRDTGRLFASVVSMSKDTIWRIGRTLLEMGTKVEYAITQQIGRPRLAGVLVRVPEHTRKGHRRAGPGGRVVFVTAHTVRAHSKRTTLPAVPSRAFLGFYDSDVRQIKVLILRHMESGASRR